MQWFIDIILEMVAVAGYALKTWVQAQGYLTSSFVDRGASDGWDWTLEDFTLDENWRILNVSAVVPDKAKMVLYRLQIKNNTDNKRLFLRTLGHTTNATCFHSITTVADVANYYDVLVAITDVRLIEYWGTSEGWTSCNLKVAGWWK